VALALAAALAGASVASLFVALTLTCALIVDVHHFADIQKDMGVRKVTALECQCLSRIGSLHSSFTVRSFSDIALRSMRIERPDDTLSWHSYGLLDTAAGSARPTAGDAVGTADFWLEALPSTDLELATRVSDVILP